MRCTGEQFMATPQYGSRQMVGHLRRQGHEAGPERVRRIRLSKEWGPPLWRGASDGRRAEEIRKAFAANVEQMFESANFNLQKISRKAGPQKMTRVRWPLQATPPQNFTLQAWPSLHNVQTAPLRSPTILIQADRCGCSLRDGRSTLSGARPAARRSWRLAARNRAGP